MDKGFSFLERVAKPPHLYPRFAGGFWTTHDYDGFVVADSVAPRLANSREHGTSRARKIARAKQPPGELFVVHAALPTNTVGPLLPPWIRRVELGGRRMHAKFGVLRFQDQAGKRVLWRAFVASANLTRGGCFRNHEVCLVEETTNRKKVGLAQELIAAFSVLEIDASLRGVVLKSLGLRPAARLRRVVHSLDKPRDLLEAGFGQKRSGTDRLKADLAVVVSPGYGTDNCPEPAKRLAPYLQEDASVYLTTGRRAGEAPRYSRAVISALSKMGFDPVVWAIDEFEEEKDKTTHRMLHAKAISLVHERGVATLLGSANFTAQGLCGVPNGNRELMVRVDWEETAFRSWDEALGGAAWSRKIAPPLTETMEPAPESSSLQAYARFICGPGQCATQSSWSGELELTLSGRVDHAWYRGGELALRLRQPFTYWDGCNSIELERDDGAFVVQIEFDVTADSGFWTRNAPLPADPIRDRFMWWLSLARGGGVPPPTNGKPAISKPDGAGSDDRHTLPLEQRLEHLARYRAQLADLSADEIDLVFKALSADADFGSARRKLRVEELEVAELEVAEAILAGMNDNVQCPTPPLLSALVRFIQGAGGGEP